MKINYEKLKKSNSVKFNGAFKKGKIKQQFKKKNPSLNVIQDIHSSN